MRGGLRLIAIALLLITALPVCGCGRDAPELPVVATEGLERDVAERIASTRSAALESPSAKTLTDFGVALFAHRRHDAAEPVLLLAATYEGADRFALFHLAGLSASVASLERAVTHLEQACAIRSDYPASHIKCGFFLEELARYDEAATHFRAALAIDRNPHALLGLGRVALARGDAEQATKFLEEARARNRGLLEASVALAQAYAARGWDDKAERVEEEAAALRVPTNVADAILEDVLDTSVSYSGRIEAASRAAQAGDNDRAFRLLDEAIAARPELVDGHHSAGILLAQLGRHTDAVRAFDRVLAAEPKHAEALARKGASLAFMGRAEEAESVLRAAVDAVPDSLFARLELARFLEARAPAESHELAQSLVTAQPRATGPRLLLARLLLADGRHEDALAQVVIVLRRVPDNAEASALRNAIAAAMR